MAAVMLKLPHEAARLLEGVEVPGDRHSASDMHVTLFLLGKDLPVVDVAKAMCAAYQVTSRTRPFTCALGAVSSFPRGDDGVPIICPVVSPGLMGFRAALKAEFDRLGIGYSKKFPEYKPHVTLSYCSDEGLDTYSSPLPGPLTWTASDMVIWGGDHADHVLSVNMPFVLGPVERAARRLASGG